MRSGTAIDRVLSRSRRVQTQEIASLSELKEASGFLAAIKDLPAWILTAMSLACGFLLFVPVIGAALPDRFRPWIVLGAVVFTALAVFKWASVGMQWRNAWKA